MPTKVDELVTRREAAELAGVHINTIRLWESTHRVDTTKGEGGVVMIPRSQIEAIVESRRDIGQDDKARIAALESETRMLRDELEHTRGEYRLLLDRVLSLAGGEQETE